MLQIIHLKHIKTMKKVALILCWAVALCSFSLLHAQVDEYSVWSSSADGYNHNSLRPVHESAIAYKKTLWYRVSLKEKQNRPFFARNSEITRLIIEAAKMGIVRPYANDSLRTRLSQEEFIKRLQVPTAGMVEDPDWADMGGWEDDSATEDWFTEGETANIQAAEYFPNQLYIMEIREDLIFDKKRSRQIHDIQSITFYIPAELNPTTGLELPLATFSYKELVQNLFLDNPNTIWYNGNNQAHHRNLAEAFDLRLFNGKIVKYDNIDDDSILDLYDDSNQANLQSQQYEQKLIEYESNLWEN
jgi:gliding motility associated protien GldN